MMKRMRHLFMLWISLLGLLSTAHATSLRGVSLDEMVARADVIFIGTAVQQTTASRPGPLGPLTVDQWTFQVAEVLKAKEAYAAKLKAGAPFVFAQARHGVPYALDGKEYCLYLIDLGNGLWAPVGMIQGVFEIIINADGTKAVKNRLNNQLLFRGSTLQSASVAKGARPSLEAGSGAIPLSAFKELVQTLKDSR